MGIYAEETASLYSGNLLNEMNTFQPCKDSFRAPLTPVCVEPPHGIKKRNAEKHLCSFSGTVLTI